MKRLQLLFAICLLSFCKTNANPIFLIADNYPNSPRSTVWAGELQNFGYNGNITPISALDFPVLSYDILIISSADSNMTPLRINNVLQFLQTGKPVYIQCEKDVLNSMNQAFVQLVTSLGGTFSWGSTTTGNFGPLQVLGTFATMNMNVPTLGSFTDGCTGSGNNTIFPFLSYNGNNYGFCFCPPNAAYGKLIATSDQGWVNPPATNALFLIDNMIYHLITPTLCGILLAADATQTNVSCNGGTDGTATVTPSGLYPAFTYLWYPGNQTTATISGLSAGTYICTITDSLNNIIHDTINITQPAALSAATGQTNIQCFGNATGSATVTVSGGTPGYHYQWAPSGGNAATATGLAAGNYTCSITDSNSCTLTAAVTLTQPASAISASTMETDINCTATNSGSASVTASGGTPGYTYAWSPSGGNTASVNNLSAGSYTCVITDNNNCRDTETVTINDAVALVSIDSQVNIKCSGDSSGYASVMYREERHHIPTSGHRQAALIMQQAIYMLALIPAL